MKNIFLSAFLASCVMTTADARIVTSVTNGNATDFLTWDCQCIPLDGDTIMINHAIVLDVDYAFTMGGIQVNAGGSVTGDANSRIFGVSGGYFVNSGTVSIAYIYHNGGTFTNYGTLIATRNIGIDQGVTVVNYGSFSANDTLLINTSATLQNQPGASCGAPEIWTAGTIVNTTGTMLADNILNTGTITHASGLMMLNMNLYNDGTITLNSHTTIDDDIWNAGNITVNAFVSARTLHNGDSVAGSATFMNNGTVSLDGDLFNSQTLNGSGDFCVSDSTINAGAVNGTLDICDQTGGGWDINVGTQQGTVTHCAAGPCTIGMAEEQSSQMQLVPNPASEYCTVNLPAGTSAVVEVMDMTGRVVLTAQMNGSGQLNISALAPGMYSVRMISNSSVSEQKLIVE